MGSQGSPGTGEADSWPAASVGSRSWPDLVLRHEQARGRIFSAWLGSAVKTGSVCQKHKGKGIPTADPRSECQRAARRT
jgi:hypothetical protein